MDNLAGLLLNMDPRELLRVLHELEAEEYRQDCRKWVEACVRIEDRDGPEYAVPFRLWPGQVTALEAFQDHKMCIVMKARQLGLSWLTLAYTAWLLWSRPGTSVTAISMNDMAAKEMVRRLQFILDNLPTWMMQAGGKPASIPVWEGTSANVTVHHPKGPPSVFQSQPAGANAGKGLTASLVILDEWSSQLFAQEIWSSAYPSVSRPTGGRLIGLSTIQRGTLFEQLWIDATAGKIPLHPVFLPWTVDPRRTPKWYEDQRAMLGDAVLSEFPATPEEALTTPGGQFFPELRSNIHLVDPVSIPSWWRRYVALDYGLDKLAAYWIALDPDGHAHVYREIYQSNLIISDAAALLQKANGSDSIQAWLAPPDLWSRSRDTGISQAEQFGRYGLQLTRASNNRSAGWAALREWLAVRETQDPVTGDTLFASSMVIHTSCPNLWRTLTAIQRDKHDPMDAADQPHELTHAPDALRYFAASRTRPSAAPDPEAEERVSPYRQAVRALTGGGKPSKSYMRWS